VGGHNCGLPSPQSAVTAIYTAVLLAAAVLASPNTTQPQQQLFLQLFLATALCTFSKDSVAAVSSSNELTSLLSVELLVAVQLFAGAAMYCSAEQCKLLHGLVSGRREAAQELLAWRGRLHLLACSNLDRACSEHLC
jgi:hypothetical protein